MRASILGNAFRAAAVVALGLTLPGGVASAASPVKLAGSLVGSVQDSSGVPQMGAIIELYNRSERRVAKILTNANGEFGFDFLLPDVYSVRINMPSFMPALKRNISVQPGIRSVLAINLASMLSSIDVVYSAPSAGTLMSDDWKWVLRGSMSTRPVLRILDEQAEAFKREVATHIFTDTRGLIRLSSGETSPFGTAGQQDLGTSFALATSVFGSNQLQVSGKIGYNADSDLNSAAFRTSFSRTSAGGPEFKLMMQQVALPTRGAGLIGGQMGNAPALRTMSVTMIERLQVAEDVVIDYGASLDSVAYMDRLNYLSPFARITYDGGNLGSLTVAYSSGAPPVDLLSSRDQESNDALQSELTAMTVLPRVSVRRGGANVQRTQNVEATYNLELGSRTFSVGYFHESVNNGALTLSVPQEFYMNDLLPDLSSNSSVFNIGNYSQSGYTLSATQIFDENYSASISAGRAGVLTTDDPHLRTADPDELRAKIRSGQRHWLRGRVAGMAPVTHTRFVASYEWTDYAALTPGHVFLTQRINPETGLNLRIRQPLPAWGNLPGRLEASAEFRNLLAQGYLPVGLPDGRRLILAHTPRSIRGGFSFIF